MTRSGLTDLHRHLDGSLRPETVAELAVALGLSVPEDLAFSPNMGLAAALARFRFTLSLLQTPAAVARVAAEICEDAALDGVDGLEIRFAPQLHGGRLDEVVDAALDGISGRAGLILCVLYGEPPELADALVELAVGRPGLVGLDLAGGPAPGHSHGISSYQEAFRRAGRLGLGRTVHAGEGRPAAEIRQALHHLQAERIGHGTTLLDDPTVLEEVVRRKVTIEACITSNWHVGAIPDVVDHPLPRWLELGIKVCINTDNTLLSAVCASGEHRRAATLPGMDAARVERARVFGHEARFNRG